MILSDQIPLIDHSTFCKYHTMPTCIPTASGWELTSPTYNTDDTFGNLPVPSQCVDYLTHDWEFEDLALSWKEVSRHSDNNIHCQRLENASWRIWAKQCGNIPTLNPAELNWYKDNDITWLYGPLLKKTGSRTTSSAPVSKSPSFVNTLPKPLKPALKKHNSFNLNRDTQLVKKPKLRFNQKVEQFIIVDSFKGQSNKDKLFTMVRKLEPTIIKKECPYSDELSLNNSFDSILFEDEDELDHILHYTKLPSKIDTMDVSSNNADLVQKCIQAVSTTIEVVCWCRNILF